MIEIVSQPRLLLRRLLGVMASGGTVEARLGRIVHVIAQNMVAEVCSVYLVRAGGVLELFATEGLKEEAVHQTRMQAGEGLVGLVAERGMPLNLSEAPQHPRFSYRPETGEDIYHSFLGVPVMRSGQVRGVMVVQNITSRRYSAEEVEVLQTIAMVIAELTDSAELVDKDELQDGAVAMGRPIALDGLKLVDGVAAGKAVFHEIKVTVSKTVADDVALEQERLDDAMSTLRTQLDEMIDHPELLHGGEHREVLETFRMFAYDRGWHKKIQDAVNTGLTADAAVQKIQQEHKVRMAEVRDTYLRERFYDLDDLANRLIRIIQGVAEDAHETLTEASIIVARSIGPADLLDYDPMFIKGVLLEDGSQTAHVTIIARAMDIPILGRVSGINKNIKDGDFLVLDTRAGHAYVRPSDDVVENYQAAIAAHEKELAEFETDKALPATTIDGAEVTLMLNAGLLVDLPGLERTGAAGIGLYRTEFHFIVSHTLPRVTEQHKIYSEVLDVAGDKPVVFRTLDVGGDKQVGFLPRVEEENPAMGWRAIRVSLDRPALLRYQLRALLYAAANRDLSVMFPMIAEVSELRRCKAILNMEIERCKKHGKPLPKNIKVGCMLEVPSLAWQMDLLLKEVDFLSIGTNDLMQFFFACDRGSPKLTNRYDLLAPSVLRFLRSVFEACDAAGVPVTLCGEMGGRPIEALALVGIGLKKLSISPMTVGPVKRMIRTVDLKILQNFMISSLDSAEHSIRDSLMFFAKDHEISL